MVQKQDRSPAIRSACAFLGTVLGALASIAIAAFVFRSSLRIHENHLSTGRARQSEAALSLHLGAAAVSPHLRKASAQRRSAERRAKPR